MLKEILLLIFFLIGNVTVLFLPMKFKIILFYFGVFIILWLFYNRRHTYRNNIKAIMGKVGVLSVLSFTDLMVTYIIIAKDESRMQYEVNLILKNLHAWFGLLPSFIISEILVIISLFIVIASAEPEVKWFKNSILFFFIVFFCFAITNNILRWLI